MPILTPYMLTFKGGLHLGTHPANPEKTVVFVPSDTLFAAMLDGWRRIGGDPTQFASPFCSEPPDPPLLITTAFPRAGDIRFYPMPLDLTRLFNKKTFEDYGKALKSIRYFSEALLAKALRSARLDEDLFPLDEDAEPERGLALQGGTLWLSVEEMELLPRSFQRPRGRRSALRYLKVFVADQVPHVTISRVTSASEIFHTGRVNFNQGCGLWFGVEWRKPEARLGDIGTLYQQAFEQVLSLLQDEGLGGDRTAGYGSFNYYRIQDFALPDPIPDQPALLLSRYHPRPSELPTALTNEQAAYHLTSVGGWLHTIDGAAQRRQRLYLVEEGSLVCPPAYPAGDVTDVKPTYRNPEGDLPHPVYRSGLALAVGLLTATKEEV
jgi:CRISPR-associated protein Csm4